MLVIGYDQLGQKLTHGLDTLLQTERQRVFNHLVLGPSPTTGKNLDEKLRRSTDNAASLFAVEIRASDGRSLFRSSNLAKPFDVPLSGWTNRAGKLPDGVPVRLGRFEHEGLVVMIATPTANVDAALRGYVETSVMLLLIMGMVSLTIGFGLSQMALSPLRRITTVAGRISAENLAERIDYAAKDDEVGKLARMLNAMLDRMEDSFTEIRRFTADASHELKTPLSIIRLQAEALLADPKRTPEQETALVAQLDTIDRLVSLVEDLLLLARADTNAMSLSPETIDPGRFLRDITVDCEVLAEARNCSAEATHTGVGTVSVDARWIRQVILNLFSNALRASPTGAVVRISSEIDEGIWRVSVEDKGHGLDASGRSRMFDRFFTMSPGGTGLGLAICKSLVELHHGTIGAEPGNDGRGLIVSFQLPRTAF